ncbi:MAG: thymidylate synthase [Candidatus Bathyarchaeota archaeon]|nr:MAG: thymidylate synthase [Candidatus Bathyarchaeota archaeon]
MLNLLFVYSDDFGKRVIRNLINDPSFCKVCGLLCDFCKYGVYSYVKSIHAAIELPDRSKLPSFIEDPGKYLPKKIPPGDICIATGIHQDILLALPNRLHHEGIKGLIIPIEDFRMVPMGFLKQLEDECEQHSIEYAFPKPFCSLEQTEKKPYISRFIQQFKIGKPMLRINTEKRNKSIVVHGVIVDQSAPCGSTWYVARKLIGKEVTKDEIFDLVAKAHHSYPCTATMAIDPEIKEPILHKAGYLIREAVEKQLFQ